MTTEHIVELVQGTRIGSTDVAHVETSHLGAISVRSGNGELVAFAGHTSTTSPLRSTAKPFQLLPYVIDDLHRRELHTVEEQLADLAVMMSSHNGEPMHTSRVARLLQDDGLHPEQLRCGAHWPLFEGARDTLVRHGEKFSTLHCNCSGKHSNMLMVCKHHGWPLGSYLEASHPLQRRITQIVAGLSGLEASDLDYALDGCSLPTFIVSLDALATLFSRLAKPHAAPHIEGRARPELLELLFQASTTHPEMIAGTGCLDTQLMQLCQGQVLAKTGAAGLYAMAVKPDQRYPDGLGIAFKVADGDPDSRVRRVVAVEILAQLGIDAFRHANPARQAAVAQRRLSNFRDFTVGELAPVFNLSLP